MAGAIAEQVERAYRMSQRFKSDYVQSDNETPTGEAPQTSVEEACAPPGLGGEESGAVKARPATPDAKPDRAPARQK